MAHRPSFDCVGNPSQGVLSTATIHGSKMPSSVISSLTEKFFPLCVKRMTDQPDIPTNGFRVNISITGDDARIIEELRSLLEKRLQRRLSIAQVMKMLSREAIEFERIYSKQQS